MFFISKILGLFNLTGTAGRFGSGNYFPLYLYPENTKQTSTEATAARTPNLNVEIVNKIAEKIRLAICSRRTSLRGIEAIC
jgi:hypothetical protein